MFSKLSGEQKVKKISKAVKQLSFILSKSEDDLINVFRLDSEEGSQNIELAILRAHLNSKLDIFKLISYLENNN